ncbi:MAG TPA: hypothetical protein VIW24_11570 [Aldersonia sp.]
MLDGEQGAEQVGVEVLHLVDEQPECRAAFAHLLADRLDEFFEVQVDVAGRGGRRRASSTFAGPRPAPTENPRTMSSSGSTTAASSLWVRL